MRRSFLAACVVVLAAAIWLVSPALSRAPYAPPAIDFSMRVPSPPAARGAHASSARTVLSPVLRSSKRFDLVGFSWRSPRATSIELRTRRHGGRWSRWTRLGPTDIAPDHARAPRTSEPAWVGGDDELQVRTHRGVRGLRARFVNVTGTATHADRVRTAIRRAAHTAVAAILGPAPIARAAGDAPPIIPRSQWDPNHQCRPRSAPQYGTVKLAVVHHTDTSNDYAPSDSAGIVLSICRYHRDTNGWNDIGYNFLVDRYGQIFEGRAGGIDRAVLGAHAQGVNSESTGIANLGTFQTTPQTEVALRAQARLVAWKLSLHGDPTTGSVTVTSSGGSLTAFRPGQRVTLPRIAGHRDAVGGDTDCPGNYFYDHQLPRLRDMVAADAGQLSGLTMTAAARRVIYPHMVRLSGRLSAAEEASTAALPIAIQQRPAGGAWTTVQTATTGATGTWHATVATPRSASYRAAFAGNASVPTYTSRSVGVSMLPAITARLSRHYVRPGGRVTIRGMVLPAKPSLDLIIYRQDRGRYRFLGRQPVTVGSSRRYLVVVRIGTARRYHLSMRFRGDGVNAAKSTRSLYVRGTPRG